MTDENTVTDGDTLKMREGQPIDIGVDEDTGEVIEKPTPNV